MLQLAEACRNVRQNEVLQVLINSGRSYLDVGSDGCGTLYSNAIRKRSFSYSRSYYMKHLRTRAQLYARDPHKGTNRAHTTSKVKSKSLPRRLLSLLIDLSCTESIHRAMPSPISTGVATGMTADAALPRYSICPSDGFTVSFVYAPSTVDCGSSRLLPSRSECSRNTIYTGAILARTGVTAQLCDAYY